MLLIYYGWPDLALDLAQPDITVWVEYEQSEIKLGYSNYSIVIRILLVAYLGYLAYEKWQ
ncbi:MAG: hypothetical protein COW15_06860 [Shewanella sp. CG12_big_fil_rev_8_21_14_0_65_47_15]|nr:MAG: hypothetical protein COW15_06860 [Shewanella sp. CG12_big_fil_rev_8_21_14_0_65_47_15]